MAKDPVALLIARARHRRRMTQEQLAEALDVSPSSVANWERGVTYPLKMAGRIEEVLGITIPARDSDDHPSPAQAAS